MKHLALAIVFVLGFVPPAWADFQAGFAAYKRGDYATAVREFRPLAEQGDATAQFYLGFMYDNGEGVPQDYSEAVKWYRKSAEQGDSDAQYSLAAIYVEGRGVLENYAEALRWFRRAAENNHGLALNSLGIMYESGWGVPQDYVQAHMWYNLAAAGLLPGEGRDSAAEYRDIVAKLMTPAQIAEAQRRAGKWRPR